ncbi:MAG: ABC transporter substrate-binding protein [Thermodesulfobacteriota bacterium]
MRGKRFLDISLALLALLFGLCAATPEVRAATARGPVVVLLSDSEEAYRQPLESFRQEVDSEVREFNLQGDIAKDPSLRERLLDQKPSLILALGAKAAYAAKLWTKERQEIPVLFAMVLNWQRYDLLSGSANMCGIAAEMAPGTQFVNMTIFSPKVRRIGLIHGPGSRQLVEQARKAAALLGLELVVDSIERSGDFARAFKQIAPSVDAFWVINDPVLYTVENMDWLEERCMREKLLCVGQSPNITKLGLALSVNPDNRNIGAQAGAVARNILLHGQRPAEIGVMDPLDTQVSINLGVAERIGLAISAQALDMATTVIGYR